MPSSKRRRRFDSWAFQGANFNLTDAGDPAMLEGAQVSWGILSPCAGHLSRAWPLVYPCNSKDTPGKEREVRAGRRALAQPLPRRSAATS